MTTYAIIGGGNIGGTIGRKAAESGLDVVFGSRSSDATEGQTRSIAAAIDAADVVVVAIPGTAIAELTEEHGAALSGKLVVDATNHLGGAEMNAHATFSALPGVRYARAFNSLGWENFADPSFGDEIADLVYAADADDRPLVEELISAVGLRPVALGDSSKAATVDAAATLWFALVFGEGHSRRTAFRILGLD